jgi:hypothetical protein
MKTKVVPASSSRADPEPTTVRDPARAMRMRRALERLTTSCAETPHVAEQRTGTAMPARISAAR